MQNQLTPYVANGASIQQNGDRNVTVVVQPGGTVNMGSESRLPTPPQPQQSSAKQLMDIAAFSADYYQLIVTTQPDVFDVNIVHMMASRALGRGYVPDVIFDTCSSLTPEGIAILKKMPAIICNENTQWDGKTDPEQMAAYARIKAILPSHRNIDIIFEPIAVFPQAKMCEPLAAAYFGLTMDCSITTLNHTAWSVMQRNLFEAFKEAGIEGMPGPDKGC